MTGDTNRYRHLTAAEKEFARRLIHSGVENQLELLRHALEGEIEVLDNDDSLSYKIEDAEGSPGIVAEAEYKDSDGVMATVSVHTLGGRVSEIEIWKTDNTRLAAPLDPDSLDVFWPAEKGKKGWWE
jgi:hypothetical protein